MSYLLDSFSCVICLLLGLLKLLVQFLSPLFQLRYHGSMFFASGIKFLAQFIGLA